MRTRHGNRLGLGLSLNRPPAHEWFPYADSDRSRVGYIWCTAGGRPTAETKRQSGLAYLLLGDVGGDAPGLVTPAAYLLDGCRQLPSYRSPVWGARSACACVNNPTEGNTVETPKLAKPGTGRLSKSTTFHLFAPDDVAVPRPFDS
jgi:hypothetical protein